MIILAQYEYGLPYSVQSLYCLFPKLSQCLSLSPTTLHSAISSHFQAELSLFPRILRNSSLSESPIPGTVTNISCSLNHESLYVLDITSFSKYTILLGIHNTQYRIIRSSPTGDQC
jgi:hypothetical protein